MTVLVTGGAGFIGSNVARRLLDAGENVRVLDNLARPGVERNLEWLQELGRARLDVRIGDVRDENAVREAVRGVTHVFHFAAQVAVTTSIEQPRADFEVNARGTLNVLEAIRAERVPPSLLYTSTNKVYGALEDVKLRASPRYEPENEELAAHGIAETRPLSFHSPYGCSKGTADQYVLDYAHTFGLRAMVFRMSCIYGPRQMGNEDQGWVAHFLIRALDGEPITIFGDGRQVRDVLYVDDLVDAMFRARERIDVLAGRAFNVGGGPAAAMSLLDLVEHLERLCRRKLRVRFDDWRVADQRYYVSDVRALEQAAGWRPATAPREGIEALHRWFGEHARKVSPVSELTP